MPTYELVNQLLNVAADAASAVSFSLTSLLSREHSLLGWLHQSRELTGLSHLNILTGLPSALILSTNSA